MENLLVTLQFQTPQDLTNFRKAVTHKPNKIDIANLRLVCECDKHNVALAMNNYGAVVIEENIKS
jgi:hypothetical protein